jgi:hypothetical protein
MVRRRLVRHRPSGRTEPNMTLDDQQAAGASSPELPDKPRFISPYTIVATIVMIALALLGAAITVADATWASRYWLLLVPIYGLICIVTAWRRHGASSNAVGRQILHWICVAIAIAIDFAYLQASGQQTSTGTGLSSLLILALGCLLAGVHMDWLFALVGLLLLVTVFVVAVAQEYIMLIFAMGLIVAIVVLAAPRLFRKWARRTAD